MTLFLSTESKPYKKEGMQANMYCTEGEWGTRRERKEQAASSWYTFWKGVLSGSKKKRTGFMHLSCIVRVNSKSKCSDLHQTNSMYVYVVRICMLLFFFFPSIIWKAVVAEGRGSSAACLALFSHSGIRTGLCQQGKSHQTRSPFRCSDLIQVAVVGFEYQRAEVGR